MRELKIEENTILWFCSDNGGLPKITPDTTGGLRGFKSDVYEGGLRVPGLLEWPGHIAPRITEFPAVVMDIFPTIAEIVGLPDDAMLQPQDGISLRELFDHDLKTRSKPIPFQCFGNTVLLDNNMKLLRFTQKRKAKQRADAQAPRYELYDLSVDPKERNNLYDVRTDVAIRMTQQMDGLAGVNLRQL